MKSVLSVFLAALLPCLAANHVTADVIDVLWIGGVLSDYSAESAWSPPVVPNNGNGGNTYRVTIANGGPQLDIDATVDAVTIEPDAVFAIFDHSFQSTFTRNDTSPFALSKDAPPSKLEGMLITGTADLGVLANFDAATGTLNGGTYSVGGYHGGAILSFKGARIVTNAAGIKIGFDDGKITDEFGNDALKPLAVNNGVLDLTTFETAGDFTNNGELNLISHDIFPRTFVVTGKLTNFDPQTKTLTGGRYVVYPTSGYTLLQFPGADIVTNAADIFVARMRDNTGNLVPSIVDEHGNDALRNFANNATDGRLTFYDFSPMTTTAARVTNAGYLYLSGPFHLPVGGVFEQSGGELGLAIGSFRGQLDTHGGSIHLNGGRLTGGGRLLGDTFSNAVISPGEYNYQPTTTFQGALTLGPTSVLRFDIAGLDRGPGAPGRPTTPPLLGYDAIDCTGNVTIDGKLQVTLAFIPASGDTFVLMQAQAPIAGSFSNVANGARLTTTDGRGSFIVSYGPNTAFDPKAVVLSSFQPNTKPAVLLNLSSRGTVASGQRAMIGGFIVTGSEPKPVILRALGPSMRGLGVSGVLEDPTLTLHDASGTSLGSNDDWQQSAQRTDIQATGLPPSDAREAAIIATLAPGNYTAVLEGKQGKSGVALVEIYDLDASTQSQLANLSTRGYAGSGDNALIGGIIIGGGTGSTDILMRALGPSLSKSGVMVTLEDPYLSLRNQQTGLYGNDDWQQSPQRTDIQATGIPPSDDRESAIIWSLAPGAYTAVVAPSLATGTPGGVGLVEFYRLR